MRYYARLFAFDPIKQMKSAYSDIIATKTLRSNDEYYTDSDTSLLSTLSLKPTLNSDSVAIFNIDNTNINTILKQITSDSDLYYLIDYSGLTTKTLVKSITSISPRIITAISQMKKTLVIDNGDVSLIIKPELNNNAQIKDMYAEDNKTMLAVTFENISTSLVVLDYEKNFVSDAWRVTLEITSNGVTTPIKNFKNMIGIKVPYTEKTWTDNFEGWQF